jgi:hypothetical protein
MKDDIHVGDLVMVYLGDNVLVAKGEVLIMPAFNKGLWIVKDLITGETVQPSVLRARLVKIL